MTIVYGIFNICDCLAEAQHGMSKVNQFPWEFSDRVTITTLINGGGGITVGGGRIFKINNSRDWNNSRGWQMTQKW